MNVPREIELKFELDQADVVRIKSLFAARFGEPSSTKHLTSVYYDTAAKDLAEAGVSLRVRSDTSGAMTQTVKRSGNSTAALFDRDEWETSLTTPQPDLKAFNTTPAGAGLADASLKLAPIFESVVDRSVWQVTHEGSRIEVALDQGRVVAGRRSQPLTELELELKHGTPCHLFGLVRALGEIGSLRPGVLTKSERGYRLLRHKPDRASKAEPLRLNKYMSTGQAFQAIVHACLRHFGLNAPLVIARRSPDALHQSRVALRRLRSALSLFKAVAADAQYDALKVELQAASQALGEARNLDVYLAHNARPEAERGAGEPGLDAYLQEMEKRRATAYDDAVARLGSPAINALLIRLVEWTEVGPWSVDPDPLRSAVRDRQVRRVAAEMLEKCRRRVVRRGRHLAALDPHTRHQVRIEAKKLRYAAEFFAGLARRPKAMKRHALFIAELEELQDALGQLNDVQTGHEIALSFTHDADGQGGSLHEGAFAASHASGLEDARVGPLLEAAEQAHARLSKAKRFWSAWLD